jgi:hypothetical protein
MGFIKMILLIIFFFILARYRDRTVSVTELCDQIPKPNRT